jgi:peptidoglycan hydrolase-like amidase
LQILQHYYTGTSLDTLPGNHWTQLTDGLWVGLVSNTTSVDLEAVGGSLIVCQPSPGCDPVEQTINVGELWKFEVNPINPTQCHLRFEEVTTEWNQCNATISGLSPSTRLKLNNREYARGTVRFDPSPLGFHAVVTLPLEEYLYGLAEVPSSWPARALQVQAIIGRSFAVATAAERGGPNGNGKLTSCGCHLRSTTADQSYVGWSKEDPSNFGSEWKAAVDDTAGDILMHPQSNYEFKIAKSFYSSSNGGASENVEDVFGGPAVPWLRSVDDQWSADPNINPLATWTVKVSDQDMATYFGWDRALDAVILQGPPGVLVKFTGVSNGAAVSKTLNGTQIRSLLNTYGFGYFAPGSPTSTAVRVSPYIAAVTDPPGFDDIVGHTFEADIEWAAEVGVTKGCNPPDNSLFCPNESVTRGQMAAFLNRYLNLPAASKDYFDDDNGSIFENDINRLAEAGITKGCNPPDNDEFCPTDHVTRQQMAAFLVRAFELSDNTHAGFDDVPESNTFFNDIGKLATAGITKGCNPPANTNYCPKEDVTRGQMTAFLHRAEQN